MNISNRYVLLMGDFNARTQNKQDFLEEDEFFMHHFDFDKEMISHFNTASILEQCNLPKERISQDKIIIVLGFNDTSTLVGHFVSSPREREKRDRRDSRRDEREEQGRKRNRNEREETEEIKTFPLYLYLLQR